MLLVMLCSGGPKKKRSTIVERIRMCAYAFGLMVSSMANTHFLKIHLSVNQKEIHYLKLLNY